MTKLFKMYSILFFVMEIIKKELDNHHLAIYNVFVNYKTPKCDLIRLIRRFMCDNYVFKVTR